MAQVGAQVTFFNGVTDEVPGPRGDHFPLDDEHLTGESNLPSSNSSEREPAFYLPLFQTIFSTTTPFRFVTTTYATSRISCCVLRDGIFSATFGAAAFRRTLPTIS